MTKGRLAVILLALAGAITVVTFVSPASYYLDAFQIRLSVGLFDHGYTSFTIPPVGSVRARTHATPLLLDISLINVDLALLQELIRTADIGRLTAETVSRLEHIIGRFVLRTMFLATAGGVLGSLLAGRATRRRLGAGALAGFIFMGLLLGATFATYDRGAFDRPEYDGILEAAPWMVGTAQESLSRVNELGEQMRVTARNLYTLFGRIAELEAVGSVDADLQVLLVSDLHNNPAGLEFVKEIVSAFGADLVIDAGDFTDWGTALEASLADKLRELSVPYVFVPGNHDSPEVLETLEEIPAVEVLDLGVVEVEGLRIAGIADPSSASSSPQVASSSEIREAERRLREALGEQSVDMVVIHYPALAYRFRGVSGILVHGHSHAVVLKNEDSTLVLNPGTTGAAGIRGLGVQGEVPYGVMLLYLKEVDGSKRPVAVDVIQVYNLKSGFSLKRTLIDRDGRLFQ